MDEENPFRVSKAPALPRRPSTTGSSSSTAANDYRQYNDSSSSTVGPPSSTKTKQTASSMMNNPRKPKSIISISKDDEIPEVRPSFNDNPPFGESRIPVRDDTTVDEDETISNSNDNNNGGNSSNSIVFGKSSTKRTNCCTTCMKIYCWQKGVKEVAQSRNLSHAVLLVGGILSFSLFILSCYLLNTPQPFTQHMLNWRIPLSFFTTIIASAAIANSCLFQLRSLLVMAISLPVCGCLFVYCMVIDATAATARYDVCSKLTETVRNNDKGCLTNLYTTIVLMDLVMFLYLIYIGLVAWYHRKSLIRTPLTSSATTATSRKGKKNSGNNNGQDNNNNNEAEINVFRQAPPPDE